MDSPASLRARFFFGGLPDQVQMEPFTGRATPATLEDYWARLSQAWFQRRLCEVADDQEAKRGLVEYLEVARRFTEKVAYLRLRSSRGEQATKLQRHMERKPWYREYRELRRAQRTRRDSPVHVVVEAVSQPAVVDLDADDCVVVDERKPAPRRVTFDLDADDGLPGFEMN